MTERPYRRNVGGVLFNAAGRVFVARRADLPHTEAAPGGWQLPQGGIDADEDPQAAVLREMREEIGTDRMDIIGAYPGWLSYDFPAGLAAPIAREWRGQTQLWFALRFTGTDADIRLDLDPHPEFDAWRWVPLAELAALAVPFKRPIYGALATAFAQFAG